MPRIRHSVSSLSQKVGSTSGATSSTASIAAITSRRLLSPTRGLARLAPASTLAPLRLDVAKQAGGPQQQHRRHHGERERHREIGLQYLAKGVGHADEQTAPERATEG